MLKKNLILLKQLLGLKEVIDAGQIQKAAIKMVLGNRIYHASLQHLKKKPGVAY